MTGVRLALVVTALVLPASAALAETPSRPVTFARDVAPILQQKCEACHRPNSIAPMSLITYNDVRPWAAAIKSRVAARQMPPWDIVKTVGNYGEIFERNVGKGTPLNFERGYNQPWTAGGLLYSPPFR